MIRINKPRYYFLNQIRPDNIFHWRYEAIVSKKPIVVKKNFQNHLPILHFRRYIQVYHNDCLKLFRYAAHVGHVYR